MRQGVLAFTFAVACGFAVLTAPSAHAAILSFGTPNQPFGGFGCADVRSANIAPGTVIQAYACNGAPNQQFELNGVTIYALGAQRCLDIQGGAIVAGAKVDSYTCTGNNNQKWYYYNGQIATYVSGLCLDAGNGANLTQLDINTCNSTTNQQWQIK